MDTFPGEAQQRKPAGAAKPSGTFKSFTTRLRSGQGSGSSPPSPLELGVRGSGVHGPQATNKPQKNRTGVLHCNDDSNFQGGGAWSASTTPRAASTRCPSTVRRQETAVVSSSCRPAPCLESVPLRNMGGSLF